VKVSFVRTIPLVRNRQALASAFLLRDSSVAGVYVLVAWVVLRGWPQVDWLYGAVDSARVSKRVVVRSDEVWYTFEDGY